MNKKKQSSDNKEEKYQYFDVTADIGFYSFGKTLEESFANSGFAMFNLITDTKKVKASTIKKIVVKSEDLVLLLYNYLEELLFLHEVDFILFSNFEIKNINKKENGYELIAEVGGEQINWDIHERKSEIKAITLHQMEVKKDKGKYVLKVILDL
ncbi:MAG: archease [Methanobrevibacter sp.]|jgi:SHS2 domain-containing protein|nr:archease [Methanobrevibacter sp.]